MNGDVLALGCGDLLALGAMGLLAAAGAARRGSAATSKLDAEQKQLRVLLQRRAAGGGVFNERLIERAEARIAQLEAIPERGITEEVRRERAWRLAQRLADLVRSEPGAPRVVRAWRSKTVGDAPRVYFPDPIGYASVGRDGSVSTITRGRQTLDETAMYPAWRRAWRAARQVYIAELKAEIEAGIE